MQNGHAFSSGSAYPPAPVSSTCGRRAAKLRRKALAKIQKSTARKLRLGRHEAGMAEALLQVGGSWRQVKQKAKSCAYTAVD